jgi:serine/threonine protein phosphatase 1
MFAVIDRDLRGNASIRPIHVFLGDYIDRGAATCETIELLIDRARHFECVFLKGNHEIMMFEVLNNPEKIDVWRQYGGLQTLASYGLHPTLKPDAGEQSVLVAEFRRRVPVTHRQFFRQLRPSYECGDFFFAHAGVKPGIPLEQQHEDDLCWIRDEFLHSTESFDKYIVHGHSPVTTPDIRPNRINIDTGAYATGNLSLLTIQGDRLLVV